MPKLKTCACCKISKLESKTEKQKNCCLLCGLEILLYGDYKKRWPNIERIEQ